jgi:hypothetical protein
MTAERAEQWAAWRREGWSYDKISGADELKPVRQSIKKYLKEYGYAYDGTPLGDSVPEPTPEPAPLVTVKTAVPAAPDAANGQGDVEHQLAALQQLVSTLTASDVHVSGRIRVELTAEIAL